MLKNMKYKNKTLDKRSEALLGSKNEKLFKGHIKLSR